MESDYLHAQSTENATRKTLYGSLPFVAAFGMQKKEKTLKRYISAVSLDKLAQSEMEELRIPVKYMHDYGLFSYFC
jgi:hypothetical protein